MLQNFRYWLFSACGIVTLWTCITRKPLLFPDCGPITLSDHLTDCDVPLVKKSKKSFVLHPKENLKDILNSDVKSDHCCLPPAWIFLPRARLEDQMRKEAFLYHNFSYETERVMCYFYVTGTRNIITLINYCVLWHTRTNDQCLFDPVNR